MKRRNTYTRGNIVMDVVRSNSEVCAILDLKINEVPAYLFDWGTMIDATPDKAPPCGCGDRSFIPDLGAFQEEKLAIYGLTTEDIEDLVWIFINEFHIGFCKRCR